MPRKLTQLRVRQIGLVDKGANQEADILIMKRDTETTGDGAQVQELKQMSCPDCGAKYSTQQELDAHMADAHPDTQKALDEAKAELANVQKQLADLQGGASDPHLEPFKAKYEEVTKELEKSREVMRVQMESITKELEESKAEVQKITKQRRREKFIKRVQELAHLPGAPADDFAEILDHMQGNALTEKEFEKVNQMLTSWNRIVKESAIFTEIGRDLGVNFSGPEGQLTALAKSKMAVDKKLTYAKAFTEAVTENPDIYRAYQKEQEGR